jgi:hypothetical protein
MILPLFLVYLTYIIAQLAVANVSANDGGNSGRQRKGDEMRLLRTRESSNTVSSITVSTTVAKPAPKPIPFKPVKPTKPLTSPFGPTVALGKPAKPVGKPAKPVGKPAANPVVKPIKRPVAAGTTAVPLSFGGINPPENVNVTKPVIMYCGVLNASGPPSCSPTQCTARENCTGLGDGSILYNQCLIECGAS